MSPDTRWFYALPGKAVAGLLHRSRGIPGGLVLVVLFSRLAVVPRFVAGVLAALLLAGLALVALRAVLGVLLGRRGKGEAARLDENRSHRAVSSLIPKDFSAFFQGRERVAAEKCSKPVRLSANRLQVLDSIGGYAIEFRLPDFRRGLRRIG